MVTWCDVVVTCTAPHFVLTITAVAMVTWCDVVKRTAPHFVLTITAAAMVT